MNAPAPATDTAPASRARGLTPAQLKALKPYVITLTDGRLDDEPTPDPKNEVEYATVEADLDAIFRTHLPEFIKAQNGATVPLVLFAHGGLVDEESGFATAQLQVDWWLAHGVYPIHFVWKTGIASSIWDAIGRWISGGGRGVGENAKNWLIERGARALGGEKIWREMKLDAAASSDQRGGGRAFARKLGAWMTEPENTDAITVHAIGHSAGSIFHSHLIPAALAAKVPAFESVTFLAPAVRIDTFKTLLLPHGDRINHLSIFTMTEKAELDDSCFRAYTKSLLWLVSASFERVEGTPILGLAAHIKDDPEVMALLDGPRGDIVYSPNTKPRPDASTATSHGDFDDDPATMESVLLRITGLAKVRKPFPGASRGVDLWPDADIVTDVSRGAGGKAALCIGIDDYPTARDRLRGAVNDAREWEEQLTRAGFAVSHLHDGDATRTNILGSIFQLISNSVTGDALVVQYAGHGTHAPDVSGDEDDGQDEATCPVDFRAGELILDDDLAQLWDLTPDGTSLTIFFDSCHAGGGSRTVEEEDGSRSRSVELDARAESTFLVARGVTAPKGRSSAFDAVNQSESTVPGPLGPDGPRGARRIPEVHFAACDPRQLAWETKGRGDFTGFVAPLIAAHAGRLSNDDFAKLIADGFDSRRQDPELTAEGALGEAPFLATVFATDRQGKESVPGAEPGSAPASVSTSPAPAGRDAAIATILRGVAALLES